MTPVRTLDDFARMYLEFNATSNHMQQQMMHAVSAVKLHEENVQRASRMLTNLHEMASSFYQDAVAEWGADEVAVAIKARNGGVLVGPGEC